MTPPLRTEREIVSHAHIPMELMDTRAHAVSAEYDTVARIFDMGLPLSRGLSGELLVSLAVPHTTLGHWVRAGKATIAIHAEALRTIGRRPQAELRR